MSRLTDCPPGHFKTGSLAFHAPTAAQPSAVAQFEYLPPYLGPVSRHIVLLTDALLNVALRNVALGERGA